jgi:hypothetical protein
MIYHSFGFMVNVNHSWWMGGYCVEWGHAKYVAIWHMVIKVHKLRLKIFDLEKKLGEMLHP